MLKRGLFVLLCCFLSFVGAVYSASKQPHTVVDYFQLLPSRYFESPGVRADWLKHQDNVVDVKNGYLYLQGDGAQSTLVVCLFKQADNTYLIGVYSTSSDNNDLNFYRYIDGQWQEVTQQVLPDNVSALLMQMVSGGYEYTVEMPRYGTTIVLKNAKNKKVYELMWTKRVFTLKAKL